MPERAVVRDRSAGVAEARRGVSDVPRAVDSRIDAVRGRTVVVELAWPADRALAERVDLRLDDGRRVEMFTHLLVARADVFGRHEWVEPVERWTAARSLPRERAGVVRALWVGAFELPVESGRGVDGVWFGAERVPLNVVADPTTITPAASKLPWEPAAGRLAGDLLLNQLASAERVSPVRRWRHRLLVDGLAPGGEGLLGTERRDPRDGAAVIAALAESLEARWQVALAWLFLERPEASERLRRTLAGAVATEDGRGVPWFGGDAGAAERLLGELLTPGISPRERVARAEAFVSGLDPAVAWVGDDAGLGRAGQTLARVGVVNRGDRGMVIEASDAELTPIAGRTMASVSMAGAGDVEVGAGEWRGRVRVAREVEVRPPGLRIGPLVMDWTMRGLESGEPDGSMVAASGWETAGLVFAEEREGRREWRVFVEAAGASGDRSEVVEVWLGPSGVAGTRVISVREDGRAVMRSGGKEEAAEARVNRGEGRWSAAVRVPEAAFERVEGKAKLRVGVVRMDSRGVRSAWPRAMLPWQTEPGRVVLDVSGWE